VVNVVRCSWRCAVAAGLSAFLVAGCGGSSPGGSTPLASSAGAGSTAAPAPTTTASKSGVDPYDNTVVTTITEGDVPPPVLDGSKLPKGVAGRLPDGTYDLTVTRADIATSNPPEDFADYVFTENVGTYTWRLDKGRWHLDQETTPTPTVPSVDGTYVVHGDVVTFYFPSGIAFNYDDMFSDVADPIPPAPAERFRWRVRDGGIVLTPLETTDALATSLMARHEWRPVAAV
jgi:hypothetical protein